MIAGQFGRPHGLLGRLAGRGMARANAEFSRWVVQQIGERCQGSVERAAELGPGPGIGLQTVLRRFPAARVWGIDPSPEMLSQSRKRNLSEVRSGRLTLIEGSVASLAEVAPLDVVFANHVLYFWQQPAGELARIHASLRPGGLLALGYQLRKNMPRMAQKYFPQQGYLLYGSVDEVAGLLPSAGFAAITHEIKGPPASPEGYVTLAMA